MSFLAYSTGFQGVVDVFTRDPGRYLPFTRLLTGIMSGETELTRPEREMIALHVSTLNDCEYCVGSHKAVLAALGVDRASIATVEAGAPDDSRHRAMLAFAGKLTRTPGEIDQADVDDARAAGWSDQAVEDMIGVASLFAFLNRLVDGFGIKGSDAVFAQAGGMIAEHGYGPISAMIAGKTTR